MYQTLLLLSFVATDSMVSNDACPISNYYTLVSTPSERFAARHEGDTTAILDHCSNNRVDKVHASLYFIWIVQCGRNFFIGGSIKWFWRSKNRMRAVMIDMMIDIVYFLVPLTCLQARTFFGKVNINPNTGVPLDQSINQLINQSIINI